MICPYCDKDYHRIYAHLRMTHGLSALDAEAIIDTKEVAEKHKADGWVEL